jgi:Family of unknown function (DUF6785)/Domain of unknown function (DUF6784)
MERVARGPYVTTISLFCNAIFLLALLLAGNQLLARRAPRLALSQAELLLVYSMVAMGSAFAGLDMVSILIQMMTHPVWFTNSTGLGKYAPFLPPAVLVDDKTALVGFFNGSDSFYRARYLAAWWRPTLIWIGFTTLLVYVMMCINVLVRKQWADRERLTFPITILPLEMVREGGGLWRSRLMWAGFALAGGIDLLNGFAFLYPSLPSIPVTHVNIQPYLTEKPWSAMGFTCYSFYPFAIGLGYLLPVDLLFSCWFFYFFWKGQLVLSNAMGWDAQPEFPFIKQQAFGGYMAILVFLLWISRQTIVKMAQQIARPRPGGEMDDRREGMSYRAALASVVVGTGALAAFFAWLGLAPWMALLGVILYLAMSIAITRIRAEFGPPVHDAHFSGPDSMLTVAFGTAAFQPRELVALNWFWWFNRGYRSHPMPVGLDTLRFADRTEATHQIFFWATMLAVVAGVAATFWAYLHLGYQLGLAGKFSSGTGHAAQGYNRLSDWLANRTPPNDAANAALAAGFLTAAFLFLMRLQFFWWPFHPIGYAISGSWSINLVWLPLFIAWLIKLLVLRYGGLRAYRLLLPFFLGLILGQTIVGSLWSLYGLALGVQTYSFWGG